MLKFKNNSKNIKNGDIFICTHDTYDDRHKYINDAIKNGCKAIIIDKDIKANNKMFIKVQNTNDTYYQILNNYYNYPLDNLKLIGITGTDGKTTTAMIINDLLNNYVNSSYLGTNGFILKEKVIKTKNTTPSIDTLFKYFDILNKNNYDNLVMEVSSEALLHNRCHNINFDIAVLTNIKKDHLNVHKTFKNYLESKTKLFKQANLCILNKDDKHFNYIKRKCNKNIITYGTNKKCDYYFYNINEYRDKTTFKLKVNNKIYNITSPLIGKFNVYNLVSAIATLNCFNINITSIINNIKKIKQVPGRLQKIDFKQNYDIVLDYAHTSNATYEVLKLFNKIKKGNIITVVGCAGKRYKDKRSEIGKIVTTYSDKVIFTMDDPRDEKVLDIINDMISKVKNNNYKIIENREKAIFEALHLAKENDTVLILGKGLDNYMAINDKYVKYSDLTVIKSYFKKLSKEK